jgi:DNA/RNA endonuclease YhcR with UshA esterase domain
MLVLLLSVLATIAPPEKGPAVISPADAAQHVGERVIVEGKVTQIVLSANLTTHINFGGIYPDHAFTVTIFKAKQDQVPGVKAYEGKVVRVEGDVHLYRGKPEIVLTERTQIRIAE